MKKTKSILCQFRESKELSQFFIADKLGINVKTYARYEKAPLDMPVRVLQRLSQYYMVSMEDLLENAHSEYDFQKQIIHEIKNMDIKSLKDILDSIRFMKDHKWISR